MPLARMIFNPADHPLLNQQKDDNTLIKLDFYVPVIPMVFGNGKIKKYDLSLKSWRCLGNFLPNYRQKQKVRQGVFDILLNAED